MTEASKKREDTKIEFFNNLTSDQHQFMREHACDSSRVWINMPAAIVIYSKMIEAGVYSASTLPIDALCALRNLMKRKGLHKSH